MKNNFFIDSKDEKSISTRLSELENGKVGFYSVGLYPASLAYNCAMQATDSNLLLAPRKGRDLLGAFDSPTLREMNPGYILKIKQMSLKRQGDSNAVNTLSDLILKCELVILSANSNYIEKDLEEACELRKKLKRNNVVLATLVGSFCHNKNSNTSYVLCQKEHNLAFFSGFHRHGSLRNPSDSFTANFCHPDALTAFFGSKLLDKISPNIQVTPGIHNVEAQYIKATKNISSIFAGFAHTFHKENTGILPTLLTLLLEQCLNQAAKVSMSREDRHKIYSEQLIPITELGYSVERIEAELLSQGNIKKVRDHTFSQLTAIIADVKGSMMQPQKGNPTRNFQVGSILASKMFLLKRCPKDLDELIDWCESSGLKIGGLEGIKSLRYWPDILKMYSIPKQDSSMINLLYISIFGISEAKDLAYSVLTKSRELTSYCKESVKPLGSGRFERILSQTNKENTIKILAKSLLNNTKVSFDNVKENDHEFNKAKSSDNNNVFKMIRIIDSRLK